MTALIAESGIYIVEKFVQSRKIFQNAKFESISQFDYLNNFCKSNFTYSL